MFSFTAVLLHLLHHVISLSEQTVVFLATKHHVEYIREVGHAEVGVAK